MKIQRILLSLLFLFPLIAIGQAKFSKDFKVTGSTPFEVIDSPFKYYFAGDGQSISVKVDGEKVIIQRMDLEKFKETSRKEYEDFPKKHQLHDVIEIGSGLFYIYSVNNKKEDNATVFAREIDMPSGTFSTTTELFSTSGPIVTNPVAGPVWNAYNGAPEMEMATSYDKSKILFNYRRKPLVRKDDENFDILGFYVFDGSLKQQWGEEVKMPYTEAVMNNLTYSVTKDGVAHMLAYIRDSKQIELFNILNGELQTHKLDLDAALVMRSLDLQEDPSGNLICSGYYTGGRDIKVSWTGATSVGDNVNGILHFKIDKNGKIITKSTYEFPIELINQYESEKSKEKNAKKEEEGKAGIPNLVMREVKVNDDGSTTFVGEQFRSEVHSNGKTSYYVYYYSDIVVSKIDKDGKLMWHRKLPKAQQGSKQGGMGIKFIQSDNAFYMLYLDNVKNANIGIDDVPAVHMDGMGGYLSAYKVENTSGEVTKHTILDTKNFKSKELFQFSTDRIFKASPKVFLFEAYIKGKQDQMFKIELQ